MVPNQNLDLTTLLCQRRFQANQVGNIDNMLLYLTETNRVFSNELKYMSIKSA